MLTFNLQNMVDKILVDTALFNFVDFNNLKIPFFKQESLVYNFVLNKLEKNNYNFLIEKEYFNEKLNLINNFNKFKTEKYFDSSTPTRVVLDFLLTYALENNATDIHFDYINENEYIIKFKINTVFEESFFLNKTKLEALLLCLKIMSKLDNVSANYSQSSSFSKFYKGKIIDFRLSIHPTMFFERFVIRVLHKKNLIEINNLGLNDEILKIVKKIIAQPHGFIIISGPTNSGKTTFVHSILQEIKKQNLCIMTLEDPVEYKIDGITQTNINELFGFYEGLKSILRQDPNVVFIGEIRDQETANLAMQAALTGHKIIATLHAYSISSVISRLLDFKVSHNIIAECLSAIFSLRLFRKMKEGKFLSLGLIVDAVLLNEENKTDLLAQKIPKFEDNLKKIGKNLVQQEITEVTEIERVLGLLE